MKNSIPYCTSYAEITQSEQFYKVLSLILDKVPDIEKYKIISLFKNENISLKEQKQLLNFLEDKTVQELAQKFISKKIDIDEDELSQLSPEQEKFIELMNTLFGDEQGYQNITNEIKKKCDDVLQIENNEKPEVDLSKDILESILPYYIEQAIPRKYFFQGFPYALLEKLEDEIGKVRNYFFGPGCDTTIVGTKGICIYTYTGKSSQCEIISDIGIGNITHWENHNIGKYMDSSKPIRIENRFPHMGRMFYDIYGENGIAKIGGIGNIEIRKLPTKVNRSENEGSIIEKINDNKNAPIQKSETKQSLIKKIAKIFNF